MFTSNASRMLQYYSAERQSGTSNVAHWYVRNVAFGRLTNQMGPAPEPARQWLDWHKARKWPIVGFWEVVCPFRFGASLDARLPEGWCHTHPWFVSSAVMRGAGWSVSAGRASFHDSRAKPY